MWRERPSNGPWASGVTVVDTTSCAVNWVKVLYQSGARNFIFQNMIPLENTILYAPDSYTNIYWTAQRNTTEWSVSMRELTSAGNALAELMLQALAPSLHGAHIGLFDSHSLFAEMYAHPRGFLNGSAPLNVTGAVHSCVYQLNESQTDPGVCTDVVGTDQDSYLWYDELHPSMQASRIVAELIAGSVPSRDAEVARLQKELHMCNMRISQMQTRLAATLDELDALRNAHHYELKTERRAKEKLSEKLDRYLDEVKRAEAEKDEMREVVSILVEKAFTAERDAIRNMLAEELHPPKPLPAPAPSQGGLTGQISAAVALEPPLNHRGVPTGVSLDLDPSFGFGDDVVTSTPDAKASTKVPPKPKHHSKRIPKHAPSGGAPKSSDHCDCEREAQSLRDELGELKRQSALREGALQAEIDTLRQTLLGEARSRGVPASRDRRAQDAQEEDTEPDDTLLLQDPATHLFNLAEVGNDDTSRTDDSEESMELATPLHPTIISLADDDFPHSATAPSFEHDQGYRRAGLFDVDVDASLVPLPLSPDYVDEPPSPPPPLALSPGALPAFPPPAFLWSSHQERT
ncbi:uncharacterized protein BXZ73DRAFT_102975 [Epithele typhae]|uniref:uncharacterized protein n=1 Tax=Epithele typhae TaxID=378194 RepID=UPI002008528D|nr:uncharacterized protein BXZ73DRAFT_102975 [Epithele typhae]KAH9926293.1 hypothetical protein BXZ73DRAFT_102975 [Epithele typhae]